MKNRKMILAFILMINAVNANAQDYKLEGSEVKLTAEIKFGAASAVLLPESDEALTIIKKYLDDKSYISLLRVEGHTAGEGLAGDQALSEKRALAVCKRLVEMGVDCKRLIAVGFGNQKPVADNSTAAGRAANKRIAFVNVSLRGHVIGGLPTDGGGNVAAGDLCGKAPL